MYPESFLRQMMEKGKLMNGSRFESNPQNEEDSKNNYPNEKPSKDAEDSDPETTEE